MISGFEARATAEPERACFRFVDGDGLTTPYTYGQMRTEARAVARALEGPIALDLANGPEFVILLLAAAYRGVPVVALNHRLTSSEKSDRIAALVAAGITITRVLDRHAARELIDSASDNPSGVGDTFPSTGATSDLPAVILFTTGTTGPPKAVPLTWGNLAGAARAANEFLPHERPQLWQASLPLYHVGGLEIVVRSLVAGRPFILYERFDAERILLDAAAVGTTHLSVVDKTLQDLLTVESTLDTKALASYDCVLLGGGPLNPATLGRAQAADVPVYASYGMTETASLIAASPADTDFNGELTLLPGYTAQTIDTDETGTGLLAVQGPGVTDGYLNAETSKTSDGFLITGDRAQVESGSIRIAGRADDGFISGGENVSPREVELALLAYPTIDDVVVIGVPDEQWGQRPVAVVETREPLDLPDLRTFMQGRLSRIYQPTAIVRVDELPRQGIGKPDRQAARQLYDQRLEVASIRLHWVRIPFTKPLVTARFTLTERDAIIVELVDHQGLHGLGECDSFTTDWYLPETLDDDWEALTKVAGPALLGEAFTHPRAVAAPLARLPELATLPAARSALECACWDLYGAIAEKPLWQLLTDEYACLTDHVDKLECTPKVPAGTAIGLGNPDTVVDEARACVAAGYRRIKLKIKPGSGLAATRALRAAFPDLLITVDANQSFTEDDFDELHAYDKLGLGWIEEPLKPQPDTDLFERLALLQSRLATPISLDESWKNYDEALAVLARPELRSLTIKPAKLGGITATLDLIKQAARHGCQLWIGGLFETGISRRMNAAFEMLPAIEAPGDIGEPLRYLATDIATPPYKVTNGRVALNEGQPFGLGCALDEDALAAVTITTIELS